MPERPVILFPTPERAGRSQKTPVFKNYRRPSFDRQYNRLQPTFQSLRTAFEQKNIIVQQSPVGINPDFALVFEIVGSVDNFYIAVNHCQGLEWLFDKDSSSIEPDDDFYEVENGDRSENSLDGKLYCVMSNQQAMEQLLSLWQRHLNGEEAVFQRGFAGIRDVFTKIKAIRRWDAQDRISETQVVDYWREMLAIDGDSLVPFEIELFYRDDSQKRSIASQTVTHEIQSLGGRILQECTIGEISYHAMLAELPRNAIEELINNYTGISLVHVDDIMFFRPACQTAFLSSTDTEALSVPLREYPLPSGDPIGAVLDGMPIQNHELLRGRLIIDDPDNYASGYESKYRTHGTSMASLQRTETTAYLNDLSRKDQRMMLGVITMVLTADTKKQLDQDTDAIMAVARKHMCQLAVLRFQQPDGLNTVLPIGARRINAFRTLTTESLAVFIPFKVQEILEHGGIFFGENAVSHNLIMVNRAKLMNQSALILGVPGSGKSFSAKELVTFLILNTDDDVLICDPEKEFAPLVEALAAFSSLPRAKEPEAM